MDTELQKRRGDRKENLSYAVTAHAQKGRVCQLFCAIAAGAAVYAADSHPVVATAATLAATFLGLSSVRHMLESGAARGEMVALEQTDILDRQVNVGIDAVLRFLPGSGKEPGRPGGGNPDRQQKVTPHDPASP